MDPKDEAQILVGYLKVLSEGKIRPDRNGQGTVRDAKDNMPDIEAVKNKLNHIFKLEVR